jgi:hypothetical protein
MTMKKILTGASALALAAAFATGASAQQSTVSVLDRVLGEVDGLVSADGGSASIFANIASTNVDDLTGGIVGNIDGSISITLDNVGTIGANTGLANVFEEIDNAGDIITRAEIDAITVDLGDISSVVLGAVNTGGIDIAGAITSIIEDYDEEVTQAIAGLSSSLSDVNTNVFTATSNVLGDETNPVLMLNLADNIASIDGSITLAMDSVNGSTGNISSTVLGAVNTGEITQNASTNLAGVVTSIVGRSE